jgi:hypothetical protein
MLPPAFLLQPVVALVAEIQLQNRTRLLHNFKLTPKTKKNSRKTKTKTKRSELKVIGANWTSLYQSGGRQATKCEIQISSRKKAYTRSDGWLFGEDVCRERERRRRRRRFSQQSERTVPPGNKNKGNSSSSSFLPFLRSSRPSVVAATVEAPTRNRTPEREQSFPWIRKTRSTYQILKQVHIPGPEHEVHIYEVQNPDTRGRPHIESPIWESVFFNKN